MTPHKDNKQHDKQLEALLKAAMAGYDDPAPEEGQQSKTANDNAVTSGGADAKGGAGTSGGASSASKDRNNSNGHDSNAQKPADSKKEKDGNKSVLSGVPAALPSLIKAYRIQDKARNVGFDWEERSQVWDKVKEEISEFEAEVQHMDKDKAEAEFGDVMFSLINAARLYKINPENALERTNQKFIRRFNYLEAHTMKQGRQLTDMSLEEMDRIWEEAKNLERDEGKAQ